MFVEVLTSLFEMYGCKDRFWVVTILASFLWLFSRMLTGVSAFPMLCILQMVHSIR